MTWLAATCALALLRAGPAEAARCLDAPVRVSGGTVPGLECRGHGWGAAPALVLVAGPGFSPALYAWDDGQGLAPGLADEGFHTWVIAPAQAAPPLGDGDVWTRLLAGLGPAVERASRGSQDRPVIVVGEGLAGTALYGWAAEHPELVARIATVGAPLRWAHPSRLLQELGRVLGAQPALPGWSALLDAPEPLRGDGTWFDLLFQAPQPRTLRDIRRRARAAAAPLDPVVAEAAAAWLAGAGIRGPGGEDLAAEIARSGRPVLAVAGALDRLAPPEEAHAAATAAGSQGLAYRVGFMNRDGADAGHLEPLLTARGARRLAVVISRWSRGGRP